MAAIPGFASVSLNETDKLRLIDFTPMDVVKDAVKKHIESGWKYGIQDISYKKENCVQFKLRGNPWFCGGTETVDARRLLLAVFRGLASVGWHLYATSDISMLPQDKDTLFFYQAQPIVPEMFAISLNESDKMRVIEGGPALIELVRGAIVTGWKPGIQKESEYGGAHEFKLRGNPWHGQGSEAVPARRLATAVLGTLRNRGWRLLCSVDISRKEMDKDSWFFFLESPS